MKQEKLHVRTPLIESTSLSLLNNAQVWLKMDAIQPAGSFKLRGIGHMCQQAKKVGCSLFISASGFFFFFFSIDFLLIMNNTNTILIININK